MFHDCTACHPLTDGSCRWMDDPAKRGGRGRIDRFPIRANDEHARARARARNGSRRKDKRARMRLRERDRDAENPRSPLRAPLSSTSHTLPPVSVPRPGVQSNDNSARHCFVFNFPAFNTAPGERSQQRRQRQQQQRSAEHFPDGIQHRIKAGR